MAILKTGIRRAAQTVPGLWPMIQRARPAAFEGWGMTTRHARPWEGMGWEHFDAANQAVTSFEHGLVEDTGITPGQGGRTPMASLGRVLPECGVGDGMSAYFACHTCRST